MKPSSLQVTYRRGRFFAAYLNLCRRNGMPCTETRSSGEFIVDYAEDGRAIGIEILGPSKRFLSKLNALLGRLGYEQLTPNDVAPIVAH